MIKDEEVKRIEKEFQNSKGQKYPCSNQIVLCGYISSKEQWEDFFNSTKLQDIVYCSRDTIRLKNGELWKYINFKRKEFPREYRYYKLYITRNVDEAQFYNCIYPYTGFYCKELKFID